MCDGVTQGRAGMELSLFSRDVIALATAVALSHEAFDAALLLGICDKIVPGLFIGAASFGQMPIVFVPGGPMPSGMANKAKAEVRQRFAEGLATRDELLAIHVLRRLVLKAQSGLASAQGVIALRVRRIPEGENRVTDIFHDGAVGVMNALRDGSLKINVHVPRQLIPLHAFGDGSEIGNVAEKDRERFLLRAGADQFFVARKFFHQLRRKV